MLVLGIESSCDETAVALVRDGCEVVTNVVYSQIELHKPFDGVVPEVASRNHLLKILSVVEEAMLGHTFDELDAIAVTNGPGLVGSLLVGLSTAKTLAYTHRLPLVAVNHIEGHMYAPHLGTRIEFPYVGLVVSGGHTLLYRVKSFHDMELLGSTIDDAAGEAFDKAAKVLGLGYPGGPAIDRAASGGDPSRFDLPRGLPDTELDRFNFSYSGLKTALAYRLRGVELTGRVVNDAAAAFRKAAVGMLVRKAKNALAATGMKRLVVSGGVAANSLLREELDGLRASGVEVYAAGLAYCGDNAAMIAGRGTVDFEAGRSAGMDAEAFSRLSGVAKGKRAVVRRPDEKETGRKT